MSREIFPFETILQKEQTIVDPLRVSTEGGHGMAWLVDRESALSVMLASLGIFNWPDLRSPNNYSNLFDTTDDPSLVALSALGINDLLLRSGNEMPDSLLERVQLAATSVTIDDFGKTFTPNTLDEGVASLAAMMRCLEENAFVQTGRVSLNDNAIRSFLMSGFEGAIWYEEDLPGGGVESFALSMFARERGKRILIKDGFDEFDL